MKKVGFDTAENEPLKVCRGDLIHLFIRLLRLVALQKDDYRGVDVIEENVTRRSKTYAALDVWGVAT